MRSWEDVGLRSRDDIGLRSCVRGLSSTTRSAARMAPGRWAMSSTVRPFARRSRAARIAASPARSTWEVGSSRIRIGASRNAARAIDSRCAWPPDSSRPCSPTCVARPSGIASTSARRPASSSASQRRASAASGSATRRLSAMLPRKRKVRCSTTAIRSRAPAGSATTSCPSSHTEPARGASWPCTTADSVDLPTPLGPTRASRSPGSTCSERRSSTSGPSGQPAVTSCRMIVPALGVGWEPGAA